MRPWTTSMHYEDSAGTECVLAREGLGEWLDWDAIVTRPDHYR